MTVVRGAFRKILPVKGTAVNEVDIPVSGFPQTEQIVPVNLPAAARVFLKGIFGIEREIGGKRQAGNRHNRSSGMPFSQDPDKSRQSGGEFLFTRVGVIIQQEHCGRLDFRQLLRHHRLPFPRSGKTEIENGTVQQARHDIRCSHSRTRRTASLRNGGSVPDDRAFTDPRRRSGELRSRFKSDLQTVDLRIKREIDRKLPHAAASGRRIEQRGAVFRGKRTDGVEIDMRHSGIARHSRRSAVNIKPDTPVCHNIRIIVARADGSAKHDFCGIRFEPELSAGGLRSVRLHSRRKRTMRHTAEFPAGFPPVKPFQNKRSIVHAFPHHSRSVFHLRAHIRIVKFRHFLLS